VGTDVWGARGRGSVSAKEGKVGAKTAGVESGMSRGILTSFLENPVFHLEDTWWGLTFGFFSF
jgi:hypothetical protein